MDDGLTRRAMVALAAGGPLVACAGVPRCAPAFEAVRTRAPDPFRHGVASGDARTDRVILWTRVTTGAAGDVDVDWEISALADFASLADSGRVRTGPQADWTAKVDAAGLAPGTRYFYRFRFAGAVSPTGRTQTLPEGARERLRLAAVSCAHFSLGYFNAYDHIARRDDFDAVIHLGDYLYGQAPGGNAGAPEEIADRAHRPAHKVQTLADYRARHAQYKEDPALQALHAAHPVYAIWDDHEIANDASATGAPGHEGDQASWQVRRAAALQAYHEWMPVRAPEGRPTDERYKAISFGDLATLCLLETRLSARDESIGFAGMAAQAGTEDGIAALRATFADPDRTKLGPAQLAHLARRSRPLAKAGSCSPIRPCWCR